MVSATITALFIDSNTQCFNKPVVSAKNIGCAMLMSGCYNLNKAMQQAGAASCMLVNEEFI